MCLINAKESNTKQREFYRVFEVRNKKYYTLLYGTKNIGTKKFSDLSEKYGSFGLRNVIKFGIYKKKEDAAKLLKYMKKYYSSESYVLCKVEAEDIYEGVLAGNFVSEQNGKKGYECTRIKIIKIY